MICQAVVPESIYRPRGGCLIAHRVQKVRLGRGTVTLCTRHRRMAKEGRPLAVER